MTEEQALQVLKGTGWGERDIVLGRKARFKCEYCDRDLLADIYDYHLWTLDHIVPIGEDGLDVEETLAVSRRLCNYIKGHAMPKPASEMDSDRPAAIRAIREMLKKGREAKQGKFDQTRAVVKALGDR